MSTGDLPASLLARSGDVLTVEYGLPVWKKVTDARVEEVINALLAGHLPPETRTRLLALKRDQRDPLEQLADVYNPPEDWFREGLTAALQKDRADLRSAVRALVAALDVLEKPCP